MSEIHFIYFVSACKIFVSTSAVSEVIFPSTRVITLLALSITRWSCVEKRKVILNLQITFSWESKMRLIVVRCDLLLGVHISLHANDQLKVAARISNDAWWEGALVAPHEIYFQKEVPQDMFNASVTQSVTTIKIEKLPSDLDRYLLQSKVLFPLYSAFRIELRRAWWMTRCRAWTFSSE